jgi:hypothetical protein
MIMDDVEALTKIVSILKGLDDEARKRVLATVSTFMGISVQETRQSHQPLLFSAQQPLASTATSDSSFSTDRTMSPKDFLRDKKPTSDVDRVACLAYYLTHYRDNPHFKTVDISALNVEAAQPKFTNASVSVDNARAKGLIVASIKGKKQLSAKGESYVDLLPDANAAKSSLVSGRPRKAPKKAKAKKTISFE